MIVTDAELIVVYDGIGQDDAQYMAEGAKPALPPQMFPKFKYSSPLFNQSIKRSL